MDELIKKYYEADKRNKYLTDNLLMMNEKILDLLDEKEELENTIKEVREYIETIVKNTPSSTRKDYANMLLIDYKKLLEILDKGSE